MRRFVGLLLGVATLVWVVGPQPVPRARFVESEDARGAGRAIREAAERSREIPSTAPQAGFGRREIAIVPGVHLAGYSSRARSEPAAGVHDTCYARAIALRDGVGAPSLVLGADILFVNRLLRDRALARLPVPRERVFFTATHTHSGPGDFAAGFAESIAIGPAREDAVQAIVDALAGAAEQALADLAPTAIRIQRVRADDLVTNRYWGADRPDALLDGELVAVIFERRREHTWHPAGLFITFGAHATVIGPEKAIVSPDWPGGLVCNLEERSNIRCCLFAASCVGSQAPRREATEGAEDDFQRADVFGKTVASRVMGGLLSAEPCELRQALSVETVEVLLPPVSLRLTPDLRLSPLLADTQVASRAPLSVLGIGDDVFVGFPCEITGEVSIDMKAAVAKAAPGKRLHVLSFSGDYHGYVPRDEYWEQDRYENQLSLHGPHFAEYLEMLARAAAGAP